MFLKKNTGKFYWPSLLSAAQYRNLGLVLDGVESLFYEGVPITVVELIRIVFFGQGQLLALERCPYYTGVFKERIFHAQFIYLVINTNMQSFAQVKFMGHYIGKC